MRWWQLALLAFLLGVAVAVTFGQDKPKPMLGAETHLALVKDQNEIYRTVLRMRDLESQYNAAQTQLKGEQAKLELDLKGALVNSGLDPSKYEINVETFDVTPKVVQDAKVPRS
jgi:hypothetical protein